MNTEQALIGRAKNLDEDALASIYDRYSSELYRYAMRLVGNDDLAEECVAETFYRLLQVLNKGGGPKQYLRAYLYRIAHNWITDQFRVPVEDEFSPELDLVPHTTGSPAQVALLDMERRELRYALRQLTPDQRQVIALKYLEDWKNEEIAQALGKPVGAVKSLQHRGLNALRRVLRNDEE